MVRHHGLACCLNGDSISSKVGDWGVGGASVGVAGQMGSLGVLFLLLMLFMYLKHGCAKSLTLGMSRPKDYPRKTEGSSLPAPGIPCVSL